MNEVDKKIQENNLLPQITVYEGAGKLLVKTTDEFNDSSVEKQSEIIGTVVDLLLKSNKTDTLFTIGLNEEAEVTMKLFDNFNILSLESQENILNNLSQMMRKMSEMKAHEKVLNSQWIN